MNPTPNDAINLMNGKPFSVRNGDIPVLYFQTETECLIYADRAGLKAYVTERDNSRQFSTAITLRQVFGYPTGVDTPAEQIAKSVRSQITSDENAPLSPLSKERVVIILKTTCKDKSLSKESYKVLFPYSSDEQFDRLWGSSSEVSQDDIIERYAETRGCLKVLDHIASGNANAITKEKFDIRSVSEVSEMCVNVGKCDRKTSDKLIRDLSKFTSSLKVEAALGSGVSSILSKNPILKRMVVNGNSSGAQDYLQETLGFSKRESEDLCEELLAIAPMLAKQI